MAIKAGIPHKADDSAAAEYETHVEHREAVRDEQTFSVGDAIRHLWEGRNWFFLPALAGVVLAVAIIVLFGVLAPSTTTHRFAISLTMISGETGQYANGMPYSPTDLRSPGVLEAVYERNDLGRYGLDFREFSASVAVESYSPVQLGLSERYRAQLRDSNLTTEERRVIEEQFRDALNEARYDGALISFTVPDNLRIPADVASKVVTDIPAVWSELYIEVLGVTDSALARSEASLLDPELAASLDYPLAYDYLVDGLDQLDERLESTAEEPGSNSAILEEENVTLFDLRRSADRVRAINVNKVLRPIVDTGVSRNPTLTSLSYENLIDVLRVEERLATERAQIVTSVISDNATNAAAGEGAAEGSSGGATSIAQFGDSFIDRIVELSLSGAGLEFKQVLQTKKLEFAEDAAELAKQRRTAERRLVAIRSFQSGNTAANMDNLTEQYTNTLAASVEQLNAIWEDANSIVALVGQRFASADKSLYRSLPISDRVIRTTFYTSSYLWILAFGIIAAMGALGLVAYVLRSIVRYRQ